MSAGAAQGPPRARWLWLAAAVVLADRLSKQWVLAALEPHTPVALVPTLDLTLVFNTGAAFSFLSEAGGWQRWGLGGFALLVAAALLVWLWRLPAGRGWTAGALALVVGGALGNAWDRLWLGHVVDFVDFHLGTWHWPAFNLADSAITVGAVMLVLESLRGHPVQREEGDERN